jgi:hypothetical protein
MEMSEDFCVFILSHGRAGNVITYNSLQKAGYTGKIVVVVDNEDSTIDEYKEKFPDVAVFDKVDIAKKFDTGDNFEDRKTIVYARNACFEIARDLGYRYFLQLDDDYTYFSYTGISDGLFFHKVVLSFDEIVSAFLEFLKSTNAKTVTFAQGGDLLGGKDSSVVTKRIFPFLKRKAMNSFFCDVERPITFVGRINEDVNTYVLQGLKGDVFLTVPDVMLNQKTTQSNKGGMTDVYLESGTYLKSFYSVMYCPSAVKVATMGHKGRRLHHRVCWNNATPKLLREEHKKP